MRKGLPWFTLVIGLILGWMLGSHQQSSEFKQFLKTETERPQTSTRVVTGDPAWTQHDDNKPTLNALLQANSVGSALAYIEKEDTGKLALYRHLSGLLSRQQFDLLNQWLQEALLVFHDDPQLLGISGAMHWQMGERLSALNDFFAAYEADWTSTQQQSWLAIIEERLAIAIAEAKAESPATLSRHEGLMGLMRLALEKQPQYAPFSLLMADILEQSGDLEGALYQLELAPYSETEQHKMDARKQQLQAEIEQLEQIAEGIPLERYGDQFIAHVTFNGRQKMRLLIDTGASITSLSPTAISQLQYQGGLQPTGEILKVATANGVLPAAVYQVGAMTLGGRTQSNVPVLEVNMGGIAFDGLLGMSFLGRFRFSIDQDQVRLYLMDR